MRRLGFHVSRRPRLTNKSADGRTRQGSNSGTEGLGPPTRSETLTSLPPYSSPRPNWDPVTESLQHAKTPADLLGLSTEYQRKTSRTELPNLQYQPESSNGKGIRASPDTSPTTLGPLTEQNELPELDPKDAMRRQDINEVTVSPSGLGISRPLSEGSSVASRVFTSPTISSRRTSLTETMSSTSRRDSIFALESAVIEMAMENLGGVRASYYKEKSKVSYPISAIESFRNKNTRRRYIIISPPLSSNIKLYLGTYIFCSRAWSTY